MKFNKKYDVSPEFESLFTFKSKKEEIEHEAKMLMFRFLSELEQLKSEKPLMKKDVAHAMGTSPSYVTQLFQGDKLINLISLAKLQDAYDFTFEVQATPNSVQYSEEFAQSFKPEILKNRIDDENGFWVFVNANPDYSKSELEQEKYDTKLKVA